MTNKTLTCLLTKLFFLDLSCFRPSRFSVCDQFLIFLENKFTTKPCKYFLVGSFSFSSPTLHILCMIFFCFHTSRDWNTSFWLDGVCTFCLSRLHSVWNKRKREINQEVYLISRDDIFCLQIFKIYLFSKLQFTSKVLVEGD